MARRTEKSPLVLILDARGTHKPAKSRFGRKLFFQSIFGVEKWGVGPRNEYSEMAGGPLKEDKRRYETDRFPQKRRRKDSDYEIKKKGTKEGRNK